jgi:hypothetical protein
MRHEDGFVEFDGCRAQPPGAFVSRSTPHLTLPQTSRTRVAMTSDTSAGVVHVSFPFADKRIKPGPLNVTFCGELEGIALHLMLANSPDALYMFPRRSVDGTRKLAVGERR